MGLGSKGPFLGKCQAACCPQQEAALAPTLTPGEQVPYSHAGPGCSASHGRWACTAALRGNTWPSGGGASHSSPQPSRSRAPLTPAQGSNPRSMSQMPVPGSADPREALPMGQPGCALQIGLLPSPSWVPTRQAWGSRCMAAWGRMGDAATRSLEERPEASHAWLCPCPWLLALLGAAAARCQAGDWGPRREQPEVCPRSMQGSVCPRWHPARLRVQCRRGDPRNTACLGSGPNNKRPHARATQGSEP